MPKTEIVAEIAHLLGFEPPPMSAGATEPRELLVMIDQRLGLDLQATAKVDLARGIVESAGHIWYRSYSSRGNVITAGGLRAVRDAVEALIPDVVRPHAFKLAESFPSDGYPNSLILVEREWDDQSRYETAYVLVFIDDRGAPRKIGDLKIGHRGMGHGHRAQDADKDDAIRRPTLPHEFERLGDEFFSVGQDASYYDRLGGLGPALRAHILTALRDMAYDERVYREFSEEQVLNASILRTVPRATLEGQFRRIARGGAKLTTYDFSFIWKGPAARIDFSIAPYSKPPTNLHALIGRNGAGKTTVLKAMARAALLEIPHLSLPGEGRFEFAGSKRSPDVELPFSGLVLASFSAFDDLNLPKPQGKAISFARVGFPAPSSNANGNPSNLPSLARKLSESVRTCLRGSRRQRWQAALRTLESDPIFAQERLSELVSFDDRNLHPSLVNRHVLDAYASMSSGHKIALLAITQLVEVVEERSLVLIDEPESHLHPPLLASFLRAVTDLLVDRNAVGIVATHSPVVLQEIPRRCVSILRREGSLQRVERPRIETFGESVSTLTRDVFSLEVTRSGFHRLLVDEVESEASFEEIEEAFSGQLGSEARAVLLAAIAGRRS